MGKKWRPHTWKNDDKLDYNTVVFALSLACIGLAVGFSVIMWSVK